MSSVDVVAAVSTVVVTVVGGGMKRRYKGINYQVTDKSNVLVHGVLILSLSGQ